MATLGRIPKNTREIGDRPQPNKNCITKDMPYPPVPAREGPVRLVRRSSEAPQLRTSCGFIWGDNGPFTAVLMAKCCLFVPPRIGFGWYPVSTTEEVKSWIFMRQKVLDPPLYWNIICLRSDMFASQLLGFLGHNSLPSMSTRPLKHSKTHISRPHSRAKPIH